MADADPAGPAVAALAAPPTYLGYALAVQRSLGLPTALPRADLGTAVALLALAELAALAVLGYRWGLRAGPAVAVVATLAWPWLYARVPFGGTDLLIPWTLALLTGSLELARRRPVLDGSAGRTGLTVGAGLFLGAAAVQTVTRPYLLDLTGAFWWLGLAFVAAPALGLVWVGTAAVLLWHREGLVAPAGTVAAWTAWVCAAFLANAGRYPLTTADGFGLFADPAADVRASWVLAAVALVGVAALERWVRGRRDSGAAASRDRATEV